LTVAFAVQVFGDRSSATVFGGRPSATDLQGARGNERTGYRAARFSRGSTPATGI